MLCPKICLTNTHLLGLSSDKAVESIVEEQAGMWTTPSFSVCHISMPTFV